MPVDHEGYYGFSQFAIELNELEEEIQDKLPCTDSRFRPDQRQVPMVPLLLMLSPLLMICSTHLYLSGIAMSARLHLQQT